MRGEKPNIIIYDLSGFCNKNKAKSEKLFFAPALGLKELAKQL
jgi:hypothetical protein